MANKYVSQNDLLYNNLIDFYSNNHSFTLKITESLKYPNKKDK